jgi:hypothetical protein
VAKTVVIDELHLTLRVPVGLSDPAAAAVRKALAGAAFLTRLREAVRAVVRAVPDLAAVRLSLTR